MMPKMQVDCLELVYVTRTYEVDADSPGEACLSVRHGEGTLIDERIGESYQFCYVLCVSNEDGVEIVVEETPQAQPEPAPTPHSPSYL